MKKWFQLNVTDEEFRMCKEDWIFAGILTVFGIILYLVTCLGLYVMGVL